MSRHQLVVLTQAVPGREAEFEAWYDKEHIPDVLQVPGVIARPPRVESLAASETPAWLSLAHLRRIDGDDPEVVLAEIKRRARTSEMPLSEALDPSGTLQVLTGPIVQG